MNLPNKLTILRIILVPLFIIAMLVDFPLHFLVAGLIFAIACITDTLDGKIARSRNLVTDFGKFADPLADKILVISALVCFLQVGLLGNFGAVPITIILFREFAVSGIRLVAASSGKVVAANIWGKVKTVTQMVGIVIILVAQAFLEVMKLLSINIGIPDVVFLYTGIGLIWISTIFTIVSGIIYIKDNIGFIKNC
ncbi:MAG: CDP-diacylglycerol--glycerol-3-phosphate 3-phosphatidyltransferase [Ruminococcus sp.]|nr:CDP-diacylglycerol--glycerol-3-phosphate 3-phosphatidyltransferase [Ruminococcus sp.]